MKKIALVVVLLCAVSLFGQTGFKRSPQMRIGLTSISLEQYGPMKPDRTFHEQETVYINIIVKGLKANEEGKVVVQADLIVPEFNLNRVNILDTSANAMAEIPMTFYIPIETVERGGVCHATIVIRDMVAQTYGEFKTTFNIAK